MLPTLSSVFNLKVQEFTKIDELQPSLTSFLGQFELITLGRKKYKLEEKGQCSFLIGPHFFAENTH